MENKTKCYCGHTDYCDCSPLEELKQETHEEAAKDFIENTMKFSFASNDTKTQANRMLKCVEFGAKWQQEQNKKLYSEEEIINALHSVELRDNKDYSKIYSGMKEWFEHYKKK